MNKIFLTGNLTRDPELLETQSGIDYCRFSIAVNRRVGNGEKQADFYRVTAWRGLSNVIATHFKKGDPILIMGDIALNEYEGKDGVKRMSAEVNLTDFNFMGGRKDEDKPNTPNKPSLEPYDGDSPF